MMEGPDGRHGDPLDSESRIVNGYVLREEIGSGGMSRVYRATREGTDAEFAVKVIRIEHVAADFERRLRREPEIQQGLGHENIVRLIDWFRVRDEFFLVMEFVDGRSLAQIIYRESGPMPFSRARIYLRQILRAVNHLHALGIIHRDIKPSNVLVQHDDVAKLADFGIAKFTWQQGQTRTQKGLGTPEYMSPEQARGTAIDQRTDIYSLGITFFEMLTARKPFARGEETPMAYVEVIQSILTKPLPDPRSFQPGIPDGAVRLMAKATAKDPSDRFQSATEFLGALEMIDENEHSPATVALGDLPIGRAVGPTPAPVPEQPYDGRRAPRGVESEPVERGRGVLWAVLLLLLIGVGGFFSYRYYMKNFQSPPPERLDAQEAMTISQRIASDYRTFSIDHNPGGLASLFGPDSNVYFSLRHADRKQIERDANDFFKRIASTNRYDIQVRRARVINDSTIDGEWIFTYERIRTDGAVLRGQTSDRMRLEYLEGDWYITRETTNWSKRSNLPPPESEPQVIDVPQQDTVSGGDASTPPLFPPPQDSSRRGDRGRRPPADREPAQGSGDATTPSTQRRSPAQ